MSSIAADCKSSSTNRNSITFATARKDYVPERTPLRTWMTTNVAHQNPLRCSTTTQSSPPSHARSRGAAATSPRAVAPLEPPQKKVPFLCISPPFPPLEETAPGSLVGEELDEQQGRSGWSSCCKRGGSIWEARVCGGAAIRLSTEWNR